MFDSPLTPDVLAADELFAVLSNQRRRYALQCLGEEQKPMVLADLVIGVAEREQEAPVSDIPAEDVDRIRLSLYHSHVPKLADVGLVEYTPERELVSLSTESEQVETLVELATVNE